jgi:hypothetical protein
MKSRCEEMNEVEASERGLMLKRRLVLGSFVMSAVLLGGQAVFAAPVATAPFSGVFSHEKTVKFNLKNATTTPIKVKAGETEVTLAAGATVPMKVAPGVKLVVVDATASHAAGSVLVEVGSQLSDSTIVLN